MVDGIEEAEWLTVLKCWSCDGERGCSACGGTGSIFWVDGRVYPYSPDGEKRARAALAAMAPERSEPSHPPAKP